MGRLAILVMVALAACGGGDPECDGEVGHDEDGDGRDDGCDPCPFADDNDADADGDGIAGVCDPDPDAPNTVLKFAGFGEADAELTITGGTVEGDAFHVQGTAMAGAALWGTNVDRVWIVAGVTVDAIDSSGSREVGAVVDAAIVPQAMLPNGTYCAVGEADVPVPSTDYIEVFTRQQPAADETLATDQAVLYLSGLKQAVIQASHTRGATPSLSCAFGVPGNRAIIAGTPMPAPPPGQVGVFGFAVDAKFSFLYVLGAP
jgi:hypothetical protein